MQASKDMAESNNDAKRKTRQEPRTVRYHGKTYKRVKSLTSADDECDKKIETVELDKTGEREPKKQKMRLQTRKEYYKSEEYKKVCEMHRDKQRKDKAEKKLEEEAAKVKGARLYWFHV